MNLTTDELKIIRQALFNAPGLPFNETHAILDKIRTRLLQEELAK